MTQNEALNIIKGAATRRLMMLDDFYIPNSGHLPEEQVNDYFAQRGRIASALRTLNGIDEEAA